MDDFSSFFNDKNEVITTTMDIIWIPIFKGENNVQEEHKNILLTMDMKRYS